MHQHEHPLRQLRELLVEALHRVRLHSQDRIAVLADLRQRDLPTRALLGLLRVVVIVIVVVVIVIGS